MNRNTKQSRRSFIGALAATGASTGLAMVSTPVKADFSIDTIAFENDVNADISIEAEKWLKELQGKKFPVVYDMHEHKDFWAGIWTNIYLMTNPGVDNLGVAIVMRHGGFPFAFNNEMWAKYKLGEFFNIIDKNTNAPSTRNMYLEPSGKDYPLPGLDGIKTLQRKGVAFCVCNMALKVYSGFIAQAKGLSADDVYNDFVKNVLPGIQLAPAGVWAIGRLQQAPLNFGYINAG
jgi:hypothetical protein